MKLKKWLLALAAFAVMAVVCAVAAGAETYGDFEYHVNYDGIAKITKYTGDAENIEIPAEINGKSVTRIGSYAFSGCTSLTNITIPDSVTWIGSHAFNGCTSLTNITIPENVTSIGYNAFENCISLASITISDSVTEIGSSAFEGCTSLTSITIPDSVTEIGSSAFNDCASLTSITIPNSVTEIGSSAFEGCTSLMAINVTTGNQNYVSVNDVLYNKDKTTIICYPASKNDKSYRILDNVTDICGRAFSNCKNLTSISIPNSVVKINSDAFEDCTSLETVSIPNSVTEIYSAFSGCTSLTAINVATENQNYVSVNGVLYNKDKTTIICYPAGKKDKNYRIPDGVTEIGRIAFSGCASLTGITIPAGVTKISSSAFSGCTSLKSITIPNSVTSIDMWAFSGCASLASITIPNSVTQIDYMTFRGCASLTGITIQGSITSIGSSAFEGCTSLISITIPNSVTSIGDSAFRDCTSLTSITIPSSVTSIGGNTFYNCTSLISIIIPDSVKSIGGWAFGGCTSLRSITIPDSVASISNCAFYGCTSLIAINVKTENSNYVSLNGVLYNKHKTTIICYPAGKKDKIYKIIDGVTCIDSYTFDGCASLTSVTIPDSVTVIDNSAFYNCTSLKTVTIPKSVTDIGRVAFGYCDDKNGKEIKVDGFKINYTKNTYGHYYATENGFSDESCLVTEEHSYYGTLIITKFSGNDKTFSIPSEIDGKPVTEIGISAFANNTTLTGVTIPVSVTRIDSDAFYNCTSLKSVTIPASVDILYNYAFGYCDDIDWGYTRVDGFKIYCYSDTRGERYAESKGFDYEIIECKPHKFGEWNVIRPATYTETGAQIRSCSICGITEAETIAKLTLAKVTGVKLGGRAADALRVNWTKNASADGYIVEMYQGNKWVRVAKITSNNTTTFRKAGLKAGTAYKFRVRAYKMSGKTAVYSAYSTELAARTNPSVMTGEKLTGRAADALRINWTKNTTADGYIVEMYTGGKWVRVAKITKNSTTTYRASGLKASTVYKFRVRAYKMSGKTALYGNYSATVTARTNPSIVKGVKIGGKAKDALRVNWTKNASAQGYIVEMYKGGKWVRVAKITKNSTNTYRKAGLAKNTTYKFRVKAYYMSGKTALYGNYGSVSGKTAAK